MDKQQTLEFIQRQIATGNISKEDLVKLASAEGSGVVPATKEESSRNLINVFYAIGAIIAIIGVIILLVQNWYEIGFVGRVVVTLGISIATYIAGLLLKAKDQRTVSQVMFLISAVLAPLGSYVLLNEAGVEFTSMTQFVTALVLTVVFGTALIISKKNILAIATIGFASWAYYALIFNIFDFDYYYDFDFLKWTTMLLGVAYLLIGYGYRGLWLGDDQAERRERERVQAVLYALGTLTILGAGISIGGGFDLLFILIIFAAFYGSVYLKSRAMLTLGALFLMAHIIKLTAEYFVDSIGWPVALIAVGFVVIGVGYATFYINKKFISLK
jgi:uncharacterized membrane protein